MQYLPILLEGIDGKNGQILVLLGIGDKELVGHLLHHNILGDGDLDISITRACRESSVVP